VARPDSRLAIGLIMAVSAAVLVSADQWTKALAASRLAGRGTVRLLGDFAVLVFARNSGAFLSLGSGLPPVPRTILLVVFPVAALALLAWAILARGPRRDGTAPRRAGAVELAVVALIAAGGIGNLIDRILFGSVRDFLNFGIGGLRTGIMNLADLYILAALVVAVVAAGRRGLGRDRSGPSGPSA
jgi:signal peptidase II